MTRLIQARLINEPFDDPGLFLDFRFSRRALLFDLGDLGPLSTREIMRVTDVFVSHAHVDHFIGFDRMLRHLLHRPGPVNITGPVGFIARVEGRLGGYSWNLLDGNSVDFRIVVQEFSGDRVTARAEFRAREAFRRRELDPPDLPPSRVLQEEAFSVEAAEFDHAIPSLSFALQEKISVNVWTPGLTRLRLPVGPWLNEAKRAARQELPDETSIHVATGWEVPLGELREHVFRQGPGQRIAYLVDMAFQPENRRRAVNLARGADQLFIEAGFLNEDAALAHGHRHLTAAEAGIIAREAGVNRAIPFHFSARYFEREQELRDELEKAFANPVATFTPG
ncbi:ribonuclease Z [Faunimonas pinastri]|uniref:Ribonuclease Z n=1 Tax=Faunimonas pinastri TaxID=1855383 RepID=A0A1H9A4L4_9HYPH|nr:MBL fold metallo-hydrolase [Faunimonas pinastri]SEP71471.1 ribonuclease Z [Faunimonas pinastri]